MASNDTSFYSAKDGVEKKEEPTSFNFFDYIFKREEDVSKAKKSGTSSKNVRFVN